MRNTVSLQLVCVGGTIDEITALFGTPTGSCPSFTANSTCNSPGFQAYAAATCLGKTSCFLSSAGFSDPCPEVVKTITAVAHCTGSSGGYSPAQGTTCALNGTACPAPNWTPTWNLTMSTICQPSNSSYFLPPADKPWGLISLDWSVAKSIWDANGPMKGTIEETTTHNCALIKQTSHNTKCFIYHNMELALQAMSSQRVVMYDPSKAGLFLQYTDGQGNKNGTIYNEPGGPGDQYFWDYRVPAAADYYISSVLNTTLNAYVDGTFTDDVTGFPEEHGNGPKNINMSDTDVAILDMATSAANARLIDEAVAAGKYVWQAFGAQDGVGSGPSKDSCISWMSARCTTEYQAQAITQTCDDGNFNQSLASFLITRPPIGFFGYGWESDMRNWRSEFLWDVGLPSGLCTQTVPGVFHRDWTYGTVQLDCNSWTATIPVGA